MEKYYLFRFSSLTEFNSFLNKKGFFKEESSDIINSHMENDACFSSLSKAEKCYSIERVKLVDGEVLVTAIDTLFGILPLTVLKAGSKTWEPVDLVK